MTASNATSVPVTPFIAPSALANNPYALSSVRAFLEDVGIDSSHIQGSWSELRSYMRGRLQR